MVSSFSNERILAWNPWFKFLSPVKNVNRIEREMRQAGGWYLVCAGALHSLQAIKLSRIYSWSTNAVPLLTFKWEYIQSNWFYSTNSLFLPHCQVYIEVLFIVTLLTVFPFALIYQLLGIQPFPEGFEIRVIFVHHMFCHLFTRGTVGHSCRQWLHWECLMRSLSAL